jgi:hypothetical protein
MEFDDFKKLVDAIKDYTFMINLFELGEPTLNPHLPEMVRYCSENNIATVIHTNGNLLTSTLSKQLIDARLDFLFVSLDGINQSTYQQYRKGGNYYTVINNIKQFSKLKKHRKAKKPYLVWQFLLFKHTMNFKDIVPKIYSSFGFDYYDIELGLGADRTPLLNDKSLEKEYPSKHFIPKRCFQPFLRMFITDDFRITFCAPLCTEKFFDNRLDIHSVNVKEKIKHYYNSNELKQLRKDLSRIRNGSNGRYSKIYCEKYCRNIFNRNK